MLKAVIIVAKKPENSRSAYAEVQEDTFTTGKDKNTDENQPGSSRRHSEWSSHLDKPTVEPPVACSNLEGYKFIYWNVLNELISNTVCCQCKSDTPFRSLATIINFRQMIFCGRASWTLNPRYIAMFSFKKRPKIENLSVYS